MVNLPCIVIARPPYVVVVVLVIVLGPTTVGRHRVLTRRVDNVYCDRVSGLVIVVDGCRPLLRIFWKYRDNDVNRSLLYRNRRCNLSVTFGSSVTQTAIEDAILLGNGTYGYADMA